MIIGTLWLTVSLSVVKSNRSIEMSCTHTSRVSCCPLFMGKERVKAVEMDHDDNIIIWPILIWLEIFLTFIFKYAATLPLPFFISSTHTNSPHSRVLLRTLQIPWSGRVSMLPSGWSGPCRSLDWTPLMCLSSSSLAPSCCHCPRRNSSKELHRSQGMYSTLTSNYCRLEVVRVVPSWIKWLSLCSSYIGSL